MYLKVKKDDQNKVSVRADEQNDTVISNIKSGEIIIRNVDTNLALKMNRASGATDSVEMNIVGQAYIKDLTGEIKAAQFKGIVIVRND